jgi:hypothetical protein
MPADKILGEVVDVLFRSWVRESRYVRTPFQKMNRKIQGRLGKSGFNASGEWMLKRNADRLSAAIRKDMGKVFNEVDLEIQSAVERAAARAVKYQKRFLKAANVPFLKSAEINAIHNEASKILNEDFPKGSGLSYRDRLKMIRMRHERELLGSLRASYKSGDALARIAKEAKLRLTSNTPGVKVRVSGGSVAKQVSRVMVAEEARISHEIERRILIAHNVEYGYWRLSPEHKWEGGSEICEVLAAGTGEGLATSVKREEHGPLILEGLYRLDAWPEYPHPYCKCHMEPWI